MKYATLTFIQKALKKAKPNENKLQAVEEAFESAKSMKVDLPHKLMLIKQKLQAYDGRVCAESHLSVEYQPLELIRKRAQPFSEKHLKTTPSTLRSGASFFCLGGVLS